MKKYLSLLFSIFIVSYTFAQGYQITVQTSYYKSGIAYLTYYLGANLNIQDSAAFANNGIAIFKGKSKLQGGIYVVVFPGKIARTEFLIDKEQVINIKADVVKDMVTKAVVTGSKENILYDQYQKFVTNKGMLLQAERNAFANAKTKADSTLHEKKYNQYNTELNNYRNEIIKSNPNAMLSVLLAAMKEPILPTSIAITHQDSINNFNFYKKHYWDGVSFMDDRIIRTPFFLPKLERYYKDIVIEPDLIINDVDYKLLLARNSPKLFEYLLNWYTDEYINPKYMGQDAVFVHLYEKYHSKGLSPWLNEKQNEIITRRAFMLMSNLIGEKGANLEMLNAEDKPTNLYDIKADYTIVVFWDPHCGHCKTEVPRIDSFYKAIWKKHDVKMFAVLSPDEKANVKEDWMAFINKNALNDWVHVYQTKEMELAEKSAERPNYRQLYDVITTPTIYLLDNEKRIIGKKLTPDQLNGLLETKWANIKK